MMMMAVENWRSTCMGLILASSEIISEDAVMTSIVAWHRVGADEATQQASKATKVQLHAMQLIQAGPPGVGNHCYLTNTIRAHGAGKWRRKTSSNSRRKREIWQIASATLQPNSHYSSAFVLSKGTYYVYAFTNNTYPFVFVCSINGRAASLQLEVWPTSSATVHTEYILHCIF